MGKVYGMCRVSSVSSAVSDISIPAQRSIIREFKRTHYPNMKWGDLCYPDDETKGFFVDRAVSAWSKKFRNRPGSSKLFEILEEGDVLLMHSVSRGFRNIVDFCETMSELHKRGVTVRFVTEDSINFSTASGKLIGNILAAVAQYSSDIKSERLREAGAMRRLGLLKGRPKREKVEWENSDLAELIAKPVPKVEMKGRVFGYIRCSHIKSLESGLGLAAQRTGVESYVEKLCNQHPDLESMGIYSDDAVSAFTVPFAKRPSGKEIYDQLQPGDHLVVYRLDRAWRSIQDASHMTEQLIKRGIHIHFVSDGISTLDKFGVMTFTTLAYVAWMESHLISMKSKEVAASLRAKGRHYGGLLHIGYLKVQKRKGKKKLALNMKEVARREMIARLYHEYGLSINQIRDILILWKADVSGLPSYRISGEVFQEFNLRDICRHRQPKIREYLNSRGIPVPCAEGPMDHPNFRRYLERVLNYKDKKKLANSKSLEEFLQSRRACAPC